MPTFWVRSRQFTADLARFGAFPPKAEVTSSNPATDAGPAALDAMITLQAQIIAYIDDFKLMMIVTLAAIPLLIAFKKAPGNGGGNHALVAE